MKFVVLGSFWKAGLAFDRSIVSGNPPPNRVRHVRSADTDHYVKLTNLAVWFG